MAKIGYIQVTRQCNQKCRFCSNPENENVLIFEDAVGLLNELKEKEYSGVIFTGGEPTLYDRLGDLIEYANEIKVHPRIISNGQKLAEKAYFERLVESGLNHIHLSIHSFDKNIQAFLTDTDASLEKILKALEHCMHYDITTNINTVINKYNADHLDKTVNYLVRNFPNISHFVWNNLDPYMNRVAQYPDVIPQFQDFELSLFKAASFLKARNYTFRIERVPLCYMTEFAEYSTETRKIVKQEGREIYFLDHRKNVSQDTFFYEKTDDCGFCSLDPICAGVYGGDKYFSYDEIYPLFVSREAVVEKILP